MAKKKSDSKRPDYEQLGRMLTSIYETGYMDKKTMLKMSFLKGAAAGLGGVVGATVVLGLLLWLLSALHYIPFVNRISDNVQCSLTDQKYEIASERCDK